MHAKSCNKHTRTLLSISINPFDSKQETFSSTAVLAQLGPYPPTPMRFYSFKLQISGMPYLENLFNYANDIFNFDCWQSYNIYPAVDASIWDKTKACFGDLHEDIQDNKLKDIIIQNGCNGENYQKYTEKSSTAFESLSKTSNEDNPDKEIVDCPIPCDCSVNQEQSELIQDTIMAPPPYYADLGKKANDVFTKGYHFGVFKLDLKTKSESGVEFSSGIISNHESGKVKKVFGSLSSKYAVKDYGLTFTEKWNTDNTLATDITIQDKIAAGLKVTLEGTFAPQTGTKTGKLKSSFVNDTVALNTNLDLDRAGPIVDVAGVLNYQGWLCGVHTQFDSQKAKFSKNNFAFGYHSNDFNLHTNVDNGKDFGGSIYQKVNDKIDCGISMKWTSGSADTLFGVGAKFALDSDASLHAKVNNKSLIGLGYQQKLRPGIVLTLSAAIDGQNFNAGGHKVGVALELEP